MSFESLTPLQILELITQEMEQEQRWQQTHSTQSSSSTPSSTSEHEVRNAGRKKERWIARDDRFEPLMKKARKCAEERHAALEEVKLQKPGGKPSRAVTSRQKSSKKSAEICRIKMQVYTEILEGELAEAQAHIKQQRLARAEMAEQLRLLNARCTLQRQRKQVQDQQKAAKNKQTSISSPSFMSEVTMENDYCAGDHMSARGEQVYSQYWDSSFGDASPRLEEADSPSLLSDGHANFSSALNASDSMELPLSSLSSLTASQPDGGMTSDTQVQEMSRCSLQENGAQGTDLFIDFDEMDACLEWQPSLPTTTLFNSSSLDFSFLS